ncbi:MAG: S1 RNA-binding domain-containing protein [Candidatus Nanohaloarchaea archaeon]|nr:S1 RNA-binding domain-containing protein [Candidatus Nanohaloarchaea archaeon]
MRKYKDSPEEGDLVVIEIKDIHEHSVYADLEEYPDKEGLIHISEISRSWVRDIRKHLKEGEKTVGLVLEEEDEDSNTITLSIKRVNDNQKRAKMAAWNKERKADKFLDKVADRLDVEREELYEEIAFPFQREFGNTFDGFEEALVDEDRIAETVDEKYVDAIVEVAKKNISLKQVRLEGELTAQVNTGDGLATLRDALATDEGVEITCTSAPQYKIVVWGRNQEQAKQRMNETVEQVQEKIEAANGTFDFQRA